MSDQQRKDFNKYATLMAGYWDQSTERRMRMIHECLWDEPGLVLALRRKEEEEERKREKMQNLIEASSKTLFLIVIAPQASPEVQKNLPIVTQVHFPAAIKMRTCRFGHMAYQVVGAPGLWRDLGYDIGSVSNPYEPAYLCSCYGRIIEADEMTEGMLEKALARATAKIQRAAAVIAIEEKIPLGQPVRRQIEIEIEEQA